MELKPGEAVLVDNDGIHYINRLNDLDLLKRIKFLELELFTARNRIKELERSLAMSGECNICGGWGHTESYCPQARPGSALAVEHGCTCPVLDNHYGTGAFGNNSVWWTTEDCPLHHGWKKELESILKVEESND